ncbi:MAG: hypothetical protein IT539_06040 [Bradyrhizobiaceae bacterium]|nr:hypothetical protein [Bradyrhizobiaceae bacterium]
MSRSGVTPEMLMAFADQEIDRETAEAIERAVRDNPELAETVAAFRTTRRLAREAFGDVLAEPMPERLIRSVLESTPEGARVLPFPPRRLRGAALPLAASIMIVAGLAGYFLGQRAGGVHPSAPGAIAFGDPAAIEALASLPSGGERVVRASGAEATLRVTGSYGVDGGFCRTFTVATAAQSARGLGCKRGPGWSIEAIIADAPAGGDQYRPASGGDEILEGMLDSLGASEPLAAEQERALIESGWKR